jgi:hypothetical protein
MKWYMAVLLASYSKMISVCVHFSKSGKLQINRFAAI